MSIECNLDTPKTDAFNDFNAGRVGFGLVTMFHVKMRAKGNSFKSYLKIYYTHLNTLAGHKSNKEGLPKGYEVSK